MFHYFNALQLKTGLAGYFCRLIDTTTGGVVTMAADTSGTPIATVSGVANMALADAAGNFSFFVAPGTYHQDIYGTDATTFIVRIASVPMGSADGASITFLQDGTGAVARTVDSKLKDAVSVLDFGVVGDGVADDTTALTAAAASVAASGKRLIIPQGDYKYSVSPNWAVDYLEVVTEGRVNFIYTGTGNALSFDGGSASPAECIGVRFAVGNPVHVYAPHTAHNGVYVRAVHHSSIWANVHGCGPSPYAALNVAFAVCTDFHVTVSGNEDGGWYNPGVSAKPDIGIYLTRRGSSPVSETVSYCDFYAIIEGPTIGIQCGFTLGNNFWGGTSEGCATYGVLCDSTSNYDKFWGMDFESNTTADVYCLGIGAEFISCNSDNLINFGSTAQLCELIRGDHKSILIDTGSSGCTVENAVYNRENLGGTFTDAGTDTSIVNVRNGVSPFTQWGTGSATYNPASLADGVGVTTTVTVTGAVLGDYATASFSLDLQGITLTAWVAAANTVSVRFQNESGGTLDLASGTLRARIRRG